MKAIGFRCFKNSISYVVLGGIQAAPEILGFQSLSFPKNMHDFEYLEWVRKEIIEILNKYNVTKAGIKIAEKNIRKPCLERSEIEGVVKEVLFNHSKIKCISRVKSQLKRDISNFDGAARYIEKILFEVGLEELDKPNYQEATLACIAELPIH